MSSPTVLPDEWRPAVNAAKHVVKYAVMIEDGVIQEDSDFIKHIAKVLDIPYQMFASMIEDTAHVLLSEENTSWFVTRTIVPKIKNYWDNKTEYCVDKDGA
jgi:hypothetical protein